MELRLRGEESINQLLIVKTNWQNLSNPRLCGLLADKPTQLSWAMHNAGFQHLNLPFNYSTFDSRDTKHSLAELRQLGFRGLSLTIPHKEAAMTLVDQLDEESRTIGAINTIINDGTLLHGYNTDVTGIISAFAECGEKDLSEKSILLLGAGGAARAAVVALKRLGAKKIIIANRDDNRAENLAKEFQLETHAYRDLKSRALKQFGVLMNTSALGSKLAVVDASEYPVDLAKLTASTLVFDAVTNDTPLTRAGEQAGAKVVHGLRMLLFQALRQFELFTEQPAPQAVMEKALYETIR